MAKSGLVKKGKWWFRGIKHLMTSRYKKPEFIFLNGKEFENGSIILSNHEGTDAPMSLEMYLDKPLRMWGAYEMNSGLIKMYKYQTRIYYHKKKHWNLHLARLFCLLASPLTNLFYKGLNLISTYPDVRFFRTIKQSTEAINNGQSIVIYPEDSEKGYLEKLEGFFPGFMVFSEACYKKGMDIPIVVSYFKKKERVFVFDEPKKYSQLLSEFGTREEMIKYLLSRCNELGQMDLSEYKQNEQSVA